MLRRIECKRENLMPTKKIVLRDQLLEVLSKVQKLRGLDSDWIFRERQAMLNAVNREREKLKKSMLTEEDIRFVEQIACGHCDYSSKFALYCAELVLDDPMKGIP